MIRPMGFRWGTQSTGCNLCASRESLPLLDHDRYGLPIRTVVCVRCGLVYQDPQPTEDALAEFYEYYYRPFYEGVQEPCNEYVARSRDRDKAARRVRIFQDALKSASWIVEVGSGVGCFLSAAGDIAPSARRIGIEPNLRFGAMLKDHTVEMETTLGEGRTSILPDGAVVGMFHVLEHCSNPRGTLAEIHRRMLGAGTVLVEVPDLLGPWTGVSMFHLAHLYYFSEWTLTELLRSTGFQVVQTMKGMDGQGDGWLACAAKKSDIVPECSRIRTSGPLASEIREWSLAKIAAGHTLMPRARIKGYLLRALGFEGYSRLRRLM
jgi:SAM-dependent methyltransferase